MMFLLRTTFWVCVVLALIPSFVARPQASAVNSVNVTATDAVGAASATVADLGSFCERRPQACAAGAELATTFVQRTREGARIVYEFIGDALAKQNRETPEQDRGAVAAEPRTADMRTADSRDARPADTRPTDTRQTDGRMDARTDVHQADARPAEPQTRPAEAARRSQHTLTATDMAPPWHGPAPRREPRHST